MSFSKVAWDGRPMNISECPTPGEEMAQLDNNGSNSGSKSPVRRVSTYRDDVNYKMTHRPRGKLIIFNHEKYDAPAKQGVRTGTDVDKRALKDVFTRMDFVVDVYDNLTAAQVIDILQKEAGNEDFYLESDCLVVAVMTHGDKDGLIWARDYDYHVENIWGAFMGNKCPALTGKPKIFIIQACRGIEASEGVEVEHKVQTDGLKNQPNTARYSIPCEADILIAYSSYPGKVAHRHELEGTWFVQELCKELQESANSDDLLSILTRVNRQVAFNYEHENEFKQTCKQMPTVQSTLTRKIFLGGTFKVTTDGLNDASNYTPNDLLEMIHDLKAAPVRTLNKPRPSGEWEDIKPENQSFEITQTDDQIVKLAQALKLFLSDEKHVLPASVRKDGATILNLVSIWESLPHDQRCFACERMVAFLRTYGNDWKYMKMVTLPQLEAEKKRSYSATTSPRTHGATDGLRSLDRRATKKVTK